MSYKKQPLRVLAFLLTGCVFSICAIAQPIHQKLAAPGVTIVSYGEPDSLTPYHFCEAKPLLAAMQQLPEGDLPFAIQDIKVTITPRGCVANIPLGEDEHLYGFGLQIGSFEQTHLRKRPIVNDNPLNDLGYTHAPVPMYVSTKGYAILINILRYPTFYCGTTSKNTMASSEKTQPNQPAGSVQDLYGNHSNGQSVIVDVEGAKGIEIFIFKAQNMKDAICRYNLFSGGGALPPLWGLGTKYRVKADFTQSDVLNMAAYFRRQQIPVTMLGLEPGWQTAAYSCSYVWNRNNFPSPVSLTDSLSKMNYTVNLWEHAFVNPASPIHDALQNQSGDYLVWNGLVPDFAGDKARTIFSTYHDTALIQKGVAGFKLDECDNSNLAYGSATWSFPECSIFPSGISGEQMHQAFGNLYFRTLYQPYQKQNRRSYFDIRSLGAFASSFSASLYSDTYDPDEYVRMISNSGFCGLLWSPEVRESSSVNELMHRTQTAVLSAQTVFNSWYLKSPPWLQFDKEKNNRDSLLNNASEVEGMIKKLFDFRTALIPYLYTAFAEYAQQGVPPFRALVVDYPNDKNVWQRWDEYMIGNGLLAAPLTGTDTIKNVYLPEGNWYNFNTGEKYEGGKNYSVAVGYTDVPVFVKENTILPLATPVSSVTGTSQFEITCSVYGSHPAPFRLYEDDGITNNYLAGSYLFTTLTWDGKKIVVTKDKKETSRYYIKGQKQIQ